MKTRTIYILCLLISTPCWAQEWDGPTTIVKRIDEIPRKIAFSPDGRSLVSTYYTEVQVWDVVDGREKTRFQVPMLWSAFYASNDILVSATHLSVMTYDAETFEQTGQFSVNSVDHHSCGILNFASTHQEDTIVIVMDSDLIIWNGRSRLPLQSIHTGLGNNGEHGHFLEITEDGSRFVTVKNRYIHIWDRIGDAYIERVIKMEVSALDFRLTNQGQTIDIAAYRHQQILNNCIKQYDLETGETISVRILERDVRWGNSGLFSPQGTFFYYENNIWDVKSGRRIATLHPDTPLYLPTFSSDETKIAYVTLQRDIVETDMIVRDVVVRDISSLKSQSAVDGYERY